MNSDTNSSIDSKPGESPPNPNPTKREPWRPRIYAEGMVHITVKVPVSMREQLREGGDGNISAGVRVAVEKALGNEKEQGGE